MPDHYKVLGVARHASFEEIRRAYRARARVLHPDRAGSGGSSARAMQEVNEAWRVLRDPGRRAAYDRRLAAPAPAPAQSPSPPPGPRRSSWPFDPDVHPFDPDVDLDPRPYREPVPGPDIGSQVVRSLPWLVGAAVLTAIFVFTAVAGSGSDERSTPPPYDLVGECIAERPGQLPAAVPCEESSLGRVDLVASKASHCPTGSTAMSVGVEQWLCLRPPGG